MYYRLKILLFTALLLIISIVSTFSQTSRSKEDEYRYKKDDDESPCKNILSAESDMIFLGSIFAGTTVDDLPTADGSGNEMVFIIHGNKSSEIYLTTYFQTVNSLETGSIKINNWNWEVLDKNTGNAYGKLKKSTNLTNEKLELIAQGNDNDCKSFAKVRLTLNSVTVSGNASPGQGIINVYFTATVIDY